jgi:hypothetical protein
MAPIRKRPHPAAGAGNGVQSPDQVEPPVPRQHEALGLCEEAVHSVGLSIGYGFWKGLKPHGQVTR